MSFAMAFVASGNFHVVEPANLRDSETVFEPIAEGETRRQALRYVASELNRFYFHRYDRLNLGLSVAAVVLLWLRSRRPRGSLGALGLCLLMSISFTVYFTPTLIEQGRLIDFLPRDPAPPEVAEFYRLHGINIVLELLKMALIAAVTVALVRAAPAADRGT